jgi:signal peptidase II
MKIKHILFFIILVIIDQLTKLYFFSKNIDFGFLAFTPVKNLGIILGFLPNNLFLIFMNLVITAGLIFIYFKHRKYSYPLLLIIAGAIGNLIDRIFRGYVFDFINLKVWPVFNLADAFITIGIIWLILIFIKEKD